MSLVTIRELGETSLYPEIINKITRGSEDGAMLQIETAEDLVKSYLFKYDLVALFGTQTKKPTCNSVFVKKIIKIIASYYLARKANPNVNLELFRADYEDALDQLEAIRDGKQNIFGVPYATDDPSTSQDESGAGVYWDSNIKRTNHF